MDIRITLPDGRIETIRRDVCHVHPREVHEALGTESEAELQGALDQCRVEDWYDAEGRHLGPDAFGLEMFRDSNEGSDVWILPERPDPEGRAIEDLLLHHRERVARSWDDERVQAIRWAGGTIYAIERTDWPAWADGPEHDCAAVVHRIDHHAPGDPGHGVPPEDFLRGSSVGQVVAALLCYTHHHARWAYREPFGECRWLGQDRPWSGWTVSAGWWSLTIPTDIAMIAAADHCLGAAYRGECPGIDPIELRRHRVRHRAAFRGVDEREVDRDIERAIAALRRAPRVSLSGPTREDGWLRDAADAAASDEMESAVVADMRPGRGAQCAEHGAQCPGDGPGCWANVEELPEAGAIAGIAWIGTPRPSDRRKVVLQAAGPAHLAAWADWARENGIVDLYGGDPARGFAGGYMAGGDHDGS